jgi:hypothetical protein
MKRVIARFCIFKKMFDVDSPQKKFI